MEYTALLDRMSKLDSCAVSDAMDSIGEAGAVAGLERRSTSNKIVGRVQTMQLAAGKPPAASRTHLGTQSIDLAGDTDVIVVEQRTGINAAGWGGVLATAANRKGIRGVIVEGPARDIDEYEQIGLPVWSRMATPRTARGRIHEAGVNVDITVGDVSVSAGDLVIADGTGIVFIPAAAAEDVVARAERIVARERMMVADVLNDQSVVDVMGKDYETMLGTQD